MAAQDAQGDWFEQNAPSGGGSNGLARGQHSRQEIAGLFKELTGRDATAEEAGQWGDNIDDNYFQRIRATIAALPEAQAWAEHNATLPSEGTTGPSGPSSGGGDDWATKDYSNVDNVKAYFKSRGVDVSDSSAQYWASKYNSSEFAGDRRYFFQRLGQAEEFIGPPGSAGNPSQAEYTAPWTGVYTPTPYTPPPAFVAPDPSKVLDDPAVKMQLQEGMKALSRSAMSRGTLLTGNTIVDAENMAEGIASAGYDKVYNRAVSEDQSKYNRSLSEYGISHDNELAKYQDAQGTFYGNQDRPFNKLMQFSSLGMGALGQSQGLNAQYVGGYNNALMNGTSGSNNQYTSAAAAQAAGGVGAANAWNQAFGAYANSLGYYYNNQRQMQPQPFSSPNAGNS